MSGLLYFDCKSIGSRYKILFYYSKYYSKTVTGFSIIVEKLGVFFVYFISLPLNFFD